MINEAMLPRISVIHLFYLENWALSTCFCFCFSHLCMNLCVEKTHLPTICLKREKMLITHPYHKPMIPYFYMYVLSLTLKAVSIWSNKVAKNSTEFLYTVHSASSNVNLLHNHNANYQNQNINVNTIPSTKPQTFCEFC